MKVKCNPRIILVMLVIGVASVLAGCASSNLTGNTYSRDDARKVQQVEYGSVLSVTPVVIEGDREGLIGNAGGAVIGGIAGNSVGGGRGQSIATVVGGIVGGIVGQATQEKLTRKQGQEIEIEMDTGRVVSVVQEVKGQAFFEQGDRVRLLKLRGVTRVVY